MGHSLRSLQTESVRPQMKMTDITWVYLYTNRTLPISRHKTHTSCSLDPIDRNYRFCTRLRKWNTACALCRQSTAADEDYKYYVSLFTFQPIGRCQYRAMRLSRHVFMIVLVVHYTFSLLCKMLESRHRALCLIKSF